MSEPKFKLMPADLLLGDSPSNASGHQILSLDELHPFQNHPFKMYSEDKMHELAESVQQHGILMPILVRPRNEGGYEIISGHNRAEAASRVGMDGIPANIRELDDDQAILVMVDSNLRQRETLLPSEKAWAYRMKLDALTRQGKRTDLTSRQVVGKSDTADIIGDDVGVSGRQIQRYIRLTHLIEPLQVMIDLDEIKLSPAVELSYLKENEQITVVSILESEEIKLSLAHAKQLKELSRKDRLDDETIETILMEEKPAQKKLIIKGNILSKYFPDDITPREMENTVIKLLENWQKRIKREQARAKKQSVDVATPER
ncbi:ParB/RepB/Spo0J family partition protein [Christensenella minuta]|uniref:ParB/RepB/Spo0J family partition protein n=1 Tax=Christensenella minuta TaxID=626937 RepID=UPI002158647E|nr:ParB/RepB/Spo0J family partition protein [Christensenella minuta]